MLPAAQCPLFVVDQLIENSLFYPLIHLKEDDRVLMHERRPVLVKFAVEATEEVSSVLRIENVNAEAGFCIIDKKIGAGSLVIRKKVFTVDEFPSETPLQKREDFFFGLVCAFVYSKRPFAAVLSSSEIGLPTQTKLTAKRNQSPELSLHGSS